MNGTQGATEIRPTADSHQKSLDQAGLREARSSENLVRHRNRRSVFDIVVTRVVGVYLFECNFDRLPTAVLPGKTRQSLSPAGLGVSFDAFTSLRNSKRLAIHYP